MRGPDALRWTRSRAAAELGIGSGQHRTSGSSRLILRARDLVPRHKADPGRNRVKISEGDMVKQDPEGQGRSGMTPPRISTFRLIPGRTRFLSARRRREGEGHGSRSWTAGQRDRRVKHGKGDADSERVDAGGRRRARGRLPMLPPANCTPHPPPPRTASTIIFPPIRQASRKRDPVVRRPDGRGETRPAEPPEHRHPRLEPATERARQRCIPGPSSRTVAPR